MIKPATLEEELFVVVIPGGKVLQIARKVQGILSRQYKVYEEGLYPQIHLTIDRIKKGTSRSAGQLIEGIVEQCDQPNIIVQDFNCVHFAENKYLMLDVIEDESLRGFTEQIHDRLSASGLSVINDYGEWDFHITIISNLFSQHPLTESEFNEICIMFQDRETPCVSPVESVEIWRPTLDPQKKCLFKIKMN